MLTFSRIDTNYYFLKRLVVVTVTWLASIFGTYLVLKSLGIDQQPYSNLIITTAFLLACIGCIRLLGLSAEDVGLKIIRPRFGLHATLSLAVLTIYWAYYLFVIRISDLRPFTMPIMWGLLNFLAVSFSEEVFFRGILYRVLEERTSGRLAVLISGLLFGLSHFRQGLGALPKIFTGWLWASVRYATGMIALLIFPIHFTYNAVWLLFIGEWDPPPALSYFEPLVELLAAVLIIVLSKPERNILKDQIISYFEE